QNIAVSRPIIYGNTATPLTAELRQQFPNASPDHTHSWTIFVRSPTPDDDITYLIKKVVFKLHDTYANSSRTVEGPGPFEITETGWGEFEIAIRIYFAPETNEKHVQLYHHLKLHPYATPGNTIDDKDDKGDQENKDENDELPIESYVYDELVFNEPTEAMFETLTSRPGAVLPAKKTPNHVYSVQTESEELERLSAGLEAVYQQVQKTKELIFSLEREKA
ncbi:YNL107Wp-like protein, partial [Nadsonia fulvescens var. elongata DSM 6958]